MSEKRSRESDNEDSNDDWVGPKQSELEKEEPTEIIKKRKSICFCNNLMRV